MLTRWVQQAVMVAEASSSSLVAGVWAQTQTTPDPAQSKPHSKKVDPQINAQFQKGNVKDFIKRFESNDREVFVKRRDALAHSSADSVEDGHVSVALRYLCQTSTKAWVSASRQDKPVSSRSLARRPHSSRHSRGQPATTLR